MIGEILVGAALIAAAATWLWRWERLPNAGRMAVLAITALAALGATFMAINFHLANGGTHPWLIPKSGFDEGVDLDSLLPLLQVVLLVVSTKLLLTLRRTTRTSRQTRDEGPDEQPAGSSAEPQQAAAGPAGGSSVLLHEGQWQGRSSKRQRGGASGPHGRSRDPLSSGDPRVLAPRWWIR